MSPVAKHAHAEKVPPRTRLVLTTLDLLRRSGLAGAGINQIVDESGAPKGSVYHYFPGGKQQLVTEALQEADRTIGTSFSAIFSTKATVGNKVRTLFAKAAVGIEMNRFMKGCPVAAVTVDLDEESEELRKVCRSTFDRWIQLIADGLDGISRDERHSVAQLIFATLEGGLVLARARGAKSPLTDTGEVLALMLEARAAGRRRRGSRGYGTIRS